MLLLCFGDIVLGVTLPDATLRGLALRKCPFGRSLLCWLGVAWLGATLLVATLLGLPSLSV